MSYPSSLDDIATVSSGQAILASYVDSITTALNAIETVVGVDPGSPTYSSVAAAIGGKVDVSGGNMTFVFDTSGTVNEYVVTLTGYTAYTPGSLVFLRANNTNTGASTLTIGSLRAVNILKNMSSLVAGDILGGQLVLVQYDGASFQLLSARNIIGASTWGNAIYGDGSDGSFTYSSNYTAMRDMLYENLTIDSAVTYNTGGYRIFVRGTLTCNGVLCNNGGTGGNGSSTAGGAGGTAAPTPSGYSGGPGTGGVGGYGTNNVTNGGANGGAPASGMLGGAGGGGGSFSNPAHPSSGGSSAAFARPYDLYALPHVSLLRDAFGGGGGGGGAQGNSSGPNGGGGGGGGGGLLFVCAQTVTGSGALEANGGAGGNYYFNTAGGGGGGGGVVILICNSSTITPTATGGAPGSPSGGGSFAGANGTVIQINNT